MKQNIEKTFIFVSNVSILPKLKYNEHNKLWHIQEHWKDPEEGKIIVAKYESNYSKWEIVRVNKDLDTDEIVEWAYLDDLI